MGDVGEQQGNGEGRGCLEKGQVGTLSPARRSAEIVEVDAAAAAASDAVLPSSTLVALADGPSTSPGSGPAWSHLRFDAITESRK